MFVNVLSNRKFMATKMLLSLFFPVMPDQVMTLTYSYILTAALFLLPLAGPRADTSLYWLGFPWLLFSGCRLASFNRVRESVRLVGRTYFNMPKVKAKIFVISSSFIPTLWPQSAVDQ